MLALTWHFFITINNLVSLFKGGDRPKTIKRPYFCALKINFSSDGRIP